MLTRWLTRTRRHTHTHTHTHAVTIIVLVSEYRCAWVASLAVDEDVLWKTGQSGVVGTPKLCLYAHVVPAAYDDHVFGQVRVVQAAVRVLGLPHHQGPKHAAAAMQTWESTTLRRGGQGEAECRVRT